MIEIRAAKNCCGCTACAEICPHGAIAMTPDAHGFPYPAADRKRCSGCGLCDQVCPIQNRDTRPKRPRQSFVFQHAAPEVRKKASTAGAFVALAEKVLAQGGVVFGCAFDAAWNTQHIAIDNLRDLERLVGSKYLQSNLNGTFRACRRYLNEGRTVLFSGTPCQIAGLKKYLRKEYDRLICVDLICHGIPAPGIWQRYLRYREELLSRASGTTWQVSQVNFRDKSKGWRSYALSLTFSDSNGHCIEQTAPWSEDLYMRAFIHHLNMRPSCFHCRFRALQSGSDITIGDYWGIEAAHPEIRDDNTGINALLVNTAKGTDFFQGIDFEGCTSSYEKIIRGNPQLVRSHWPHIRHRKFMREIGRRDFGELATACLTLSPGMKLLSKARSLILLYAKRIMQS